MLRPPLSRWYLKAMELTLLTSNTVSGNPRGERACQRPHIRLRPPARAVEAVLPFEARQQAHAAREQAESFDRAASAQTAAAQDAVAGAAQAEPKPIVDVTFMVAGVPPLAAMTR